MARSIATSSTVSTLIEQGVGDGERRLADVAHGDALGDRVAAHRHFLAGEKLVHGRDSSAGLDADHLDVGLAARARATAQPAIMPPPPTGTTIVSISGRVLQHLQRDRALARDDARIVVGMDEDQACSASARRCASVAASASVSPMQDDARAVSARVLHLGRWA